jgi:hypothetical protein
LKLHRKNLQRLASLSAVGAGAVLGTADRAEAGTINWSGPQSIPVGWDALGSHGAHTATIFSNFKLKFGTWHRTYTATGGQQGTRVIRAYGLGGLVFARGAFGVQLFPAGSFLGSSPMVNNFVVNGRRWGTYNTTRDTIGGDGPFSHQYALFQFSPGSGPMLYGWIELSGSVTLGSDASGSLGPWLTIEGWAYDTSGAEIAAGDTGSAAPEPDSFALTGLAALALGAAGTRRWRAARKA